MKLYLGVLLTTFVCGTSIAQTQVPHMFSSGQPARASEVNENFSALEAAVNRNADDIAAIGSSVSSGFDLALVDATTGVQVGISGAGGDVWKLITPQGDELVQYGWPSPLPVVNTQTNVVDLWLWRVRAFYSCDDATLLGWGSDWISETGAGNLPAQSNNDFVTRQFGSLPNGDAVLADVAQNNSVVWNGNYADTQLDPAWDGIGPVPIEVDCAIYVEVYLGDYAEVKWSPFNMSSNTTLPDIVHNADHSADLLGPYSVTPRVTYSRVNRDSAAINALVDQCGLLANQPCDAQGTNEPTFPVVHEDSITLKKASYTQTVGVSAVTPVAELPGNRGEPRFFTRVWK